MVVYIEYAIIDNLIIDALIIYLCALTLRKKYKKLNVLLALSEGVTFAIVTPFIVINVYYLALIKFTYSILIVLSLDKYANVKQFLLNYVLFISYTFLLGGVCYALLNMFNIPYNESGLILNGFALPISIIVLVGFVYLIVFIKVIKYISKYKENLNNTFDVIISIGDKRHYIRGFLDSGNKLYDNGEPIVVISFATFCKMFKNFPYQKILLDSVESVDLKLAHYIKVDTVSSSANMLVFCADSILISGNNVNTCKHNVHLGVSKKNFSSFECLLHNGLM